MASGAFTPELVARIIIGLVGREPYEVLGPTAFSAKLRTTLPMQALMESVDDFALNHVAPIVSRLMSDQREAVSVLEMPSNINGSVQSSGAFTARVLWHRQVCVPDGKLQVGVDLNYEPTAYSMPFYQWLGAEAERYAARA